MACVVWHVPVTTTGTGSTAALRLFRMRNGVRCAVGFSSPEALAALLGPDQAYTELGEAALRNLTRPLGVDTLVLDPGLVAPPVTTPATVGSATPAPLGAATATAPASTPTARLQHR
ncbi:SAV_915 family protein [Kitasatospora sp. NPDC098652]|uniref:SAV_915 family protein n=1 Tax=Kitasatospora sp. NPDC098652 TaxID=3364095 RepID=UPI00382348C1